MDTHSQTDLEGGSWSTCIFLMARIYKRFLSINLGYPYFSERYTRQHIALASTTSSELYEYEINHSTKMRRTRRILMLVSFLYYVRVVTLPTINLSQIDFLHLERNVHEPMPGIYQFSCLRTNCTRFTADHIMNEHLHYQHSSDDQFARRLHIGQTLVELPFFSLCHDLLRHLHEHTQYLGYLGMLIASSSGFGIFLSGTCLPFIQILNPTGNLLLMFLVAPCVTRRVVHDRALYLIDQLLLSYTNFKATVRMPRKLANLHSSTILRPMQRFDEQDYEHELHLFPRLGFATHFRPTNRDNLVSRLEHIGQGYGNKLNCSLEIDTAITTHSGDKSWHDTSKSLDSSLVQLSDTEHLRSDFADDCVSVMRSYWWQWRASRPICLFILSSLLGFIIGPLIAITYLAQSDPLASARSLGAQVKQLACAIWLEQANSNEPIDQPNNLLDFESHQLHSNSWLEAVYIFWLAYPFCCVNLFLGAYVITVTELTCWLYELLTQLTVGLELARQMCALNNQELMGVPEKQIMQQKCTSLSLDQLREEFKQLLKTRLFVVYCDHWGRTDSRLRSARALEDTVQHAIESQQMDLAMGTELLEKLYISLRIFLEHVQHYAPTMTAMITFIHLYIYGFILIGVWYLRSINGFILWPVCLMLSGWMTANFFVLLASNFHAKAKRLHLLIWCLLAALCQCRELRLRHLHSLWRKQAVALDMDGGLALRAFNIRITYVLIIQIVIGSGTLVIFMLRL